MLMMTFMEKMQGEAPSAEVEAAASYPEELNKITDEGDYTKQIFNVDQTASYWKRPFRHLLASEEKSMPGFKASTDRWTSLIEAILIFSHGER